MIKNRKLTDVTKQANKNENKNIVINITKS